MRQPCRKFRLCGLRNLYLFTRVRKLGKGHESTAWTSRRKLWRLSHVKLAERLFRIDFTPHPDRDEDEQFLEVMIAMLSAAGFASRGCTTIETAILALEAQPPDLILTAIQVQGVSGMEIFRYVRQNCDQSDLPVMFLSATQMPDVIRRRDDGHGVYYLRRRLKGNVLVELIDNVLTASTALSPG